MQTFYRKIKENKKIYFILSLLLFYPSFLFAFDFGEDVVAPFFDMLRGIAASIFFFSAMIFDNLLNISLSTSLFNSDFIKVAWSNIRDLANVAFILGAIYIAFSMMANYGNWKKSLVSLLVIIFVINFSLFFSRVIVDAGNITARVFMTSISVEITGTESYFAAAKAFYPNTKDADFDSVGAAFIAGLKPQNLLGIESFKQWKADARNTGDQASLGTYILLQVILVWFFITFAKHMFTGAFMFLGRLVHLVFYMIAAPAFFVTAFIPGYTGLWKSKWLIPLLEKSFCIVIYLFFLWLSLIILNADVVGQVKTGDFFAMLGIFIIKVIFIIKMLDMGNKLGTKFCEDGQSTLGGVLGLAGSVGKFLPGRRVVSAVTRTASGRVGAKLYNSKRLKEAQSKGGFTGWTAKQFRSGSKSLTNVKFGGKSYAQQDKEMSQKESDLRHGLTKDQLEKMDKKALAKKKGPKKGKIDHKDVHGFEDSSKNKEFKEYDNKESLMLYGKAEETKKNEKLRKIQEDILREATKIVEKQGLGLGEDEKKAWIDNLMRQRSKKPDQSTEEYFESVAEKDAERSATAQGLKGEEKEKFIKSKILENESDLNNSIRAEYNKEKKEWSAKSQREKDEELLKHRRKNNDYDQKQKDFAEDKKQEMVDNNKTSAFALKEGAVFKNDSMMGAMLRRVAPPVSAHINRNEENQETIRKKIGESDKQAKIGELYEKYEREAADSKNDISNNANELENAVKFTDGSAEGAKEFTEAVKKMNIASDEEKEKLEGIYDKISQLVVIEKEEERVDNAKMFEDADYKYSDVKNDTGMTENMKAMLENAEKGGGDAAVIDQVRRAIEQGSDANINKKDMKKLRIAAKQSIKSDKTEIGTTRKEQESVLKTKVVNLKRSKDADVNAELSYKKARAESELDRISKDKDAIDMMQQSASQVENVSAKQSAAGGGQSPIEGEK